VFRRYVGPEAETPQDIRWTQASRLEPRPRSYSSGSIEEETESAAAGGSSWRDEHILPLREQVEHDRARFSIGFT
jgi:hypothetical protein